MSDPHKTSIYLDVSKKSWHIFNDCYGTSEEKNFVKYMDKIYDQLKEKYEEIYLLQNERFFKLYNFDDGSPFEPDYVLFLYKKTEPKSFYYQVFIEPKGSYLEEKEGIFDKKFWENF